MLYNLYLFDFLLNIRPIVLIFNYRFTEFISKIKGKFLLDSIASENTMHSSQTSLSSLSGAILIKQNIASLIDYFQSNTDSFIKGFKIGTL